METFELPHYSTEGKKNGDGVGLIVNAPVCESSTPFSVIPLGRLTRNTDKILATVAEEEKKTNGEKEEEGGGATLIKAAVMNPRYVLSESQLLSAANIAATRRHNEELRTRNVHSELIFAISHTSKMKEAFSHFGIQGAASNHNKEEGMALLFCIFGEEGEDLGKHKKYVEGIRQRLVDVHQDADKQGQTTATLREFLGKHGDQEASVKLYKIGQEEKQMQGIPNAIISRIVVKTL
eukprot:Nk52_evm1s2641 gene=Nk52_evmTU1s2641